MEEDEYAMDGWGGGETWGFLAPAKGSTFITAAHCLLYAATPSVLVSFLAPAQPFNVSLMVICRVYHMRLSVIGQTFPRFLFALC